VNLREKKRAWNRREEGIEKERERKRERERERHYLRREGLLEDKSFSTIYV